MTNFILVQLFDPIYYVEDDIEVKQEPFWINVNQITVIEHYNPNYHASKVIGIDGKTTLYIPDGALGSVFIQISGSRRHLDAESSKKILNAIGAREGMLR